MPDVVSQAADAPERSDARARAAEAVFALLVLLLGIFSVYYPTLLSGFRQLQQDLGDPRLVNYVLEHGYRWISGWELHRSLWDPPFYFPAPNVGGLHDTLVGMGPLYWPFRWLGVPPDTAYQLFMLAVSCLNFGAAYLFFRKGTRLSGTASAGGAFLFAFANVRGARVLHQQLVAGYLPVLAVLCLLLLFRQPERSRRWWVAFCALWALQMWSGFYWAWYLVFCLCLAAAWALLRAGPRKALTDAARRIGWVAPAAALGALAVTAPMVLHHLAAAAQVGFHDFDADVLPRTARMASWLYMGTPNLVYGLLQGGAFFRDLPIPVEQQLGVGLVTFGAAAWGLWAHRDRPLVRVLLVVSVVLVALSTVVLGDATLWRWVYAWVPGAGAIRAPARAGMVILLPLAAGFALTLFRLERSRHTLLAAGLLAACVAEQVRYQPAFDKLQSRAQVEVIRDAIPEDCPVFYVTNQAAPGVRLAHNPWKYHLDAMWAQLAADKPTVNGYSGFQPAGWGPVYEHVVRGPEDEARLEAALSTWLGDRRAEVCTVQVSLP